MSKTPRTDAKAREIKYLDDHTENVVDADFARQLERELWNANDRAASMYRQAQDNHLRAMNAEAERDSMKSAYQQHVAMVARDERPAYDEQQKKIAALEVVIEDLTVANRALEKLAKQSAIIQIADAGIEVGQ